ncbi:MAG: glucokinase [Pseudomonadota bacterium]|nr:glucokinase [Pseudomonadota bacterium]MDP2352645.1 glucokinase [Pseudomonadota bacterium]
MSENLVLAGDIGGTKSNLAFFRGSPNAPETVAERSYQNREFAGLAEVVGRFIADTGLSAATACFGVAGAVVAGESHLPNLGWRLSEQTLAHDLGLKEVGLINDLEANALGIATLAPEQFFTLNPGRPQPGGNQALIAAGTGLGMAMLFQDGAGYRVSASEGGHMDFAPRGEEQVALLRHLAARHGHVSVERVVSGPGLAAIYDFLKARGEVEPDWLAERLETNADRSAVIAQAGLSRETAICVKALDLFLSAYGAAAGNLALMALATGGLYLGGGIAPRLIKAFPASGFMAAFADKGRFAGLLTQMPVRIILEPKTALRGAANHALAAA